MKYSLVSASLLISSASALHLPFTRRVATRTSGAVAKPNANVLAQSGSLGLSNQVNNFYSSVLTVDSKDVPVLLDTGSTDLWLYDYQDGLLNNAQVAQSLQLTDSYGLGNVTGYISQIDVAFAGFSVANQTFLYVQEQNQQAIITNRLAAGLLGLGFDTLSNINTLVERNFPGATWGRSLLSNIFSSDPTTPNHIAFRLNRLYDSNDTDTGSANSTLNVYWSVLLDGISINGKNQTLKSTVTRGDNPPPSGKLAVVLDTGYSLPQLTTELAHEIYTSMGGVLLAEDTTNATYVVPCTSEANLTFYIGGRTIPIHPLDLTAVNTVQLNGQNYTVCTNGFQPFTSEAGAGIIDLILGDGFLRNTYTVYDFGDFTNGTTGSPRQDPYIKLLPLTDPAQASSEFQSARKAYLDTLPPQVNVSTVNSNNPQAIPSTGGSPSGSNSATKVGMGVSVATVVGVVLGLSNLI